MLKRLRQLGDAKADFDFESTLSSRTFAPFLRELKASGYSVAIYYFSLVNAQLAIRRVKLRVATGRYQIRNPVGHHGAHDMAQTSTAQPSRLMLSAKVLQKALERSAQQAQRLADACGVVVLWCPAVKPKTPSSSRSTA
jgi:hypothetical protein